MGQMLINFAIKYLREKNIKILWCDARKVAITFYKKWIQNSWRILFNS